MLPEIVVAIADEGVSLQKVLVCLPLEENVISLFRRTNGIEHIGISLAMETLLECLDMEA